MAWFSLAKIAMQAGAKIYSNRQKNKNGNVGRTTYACGEDGSW